MNALITTLVFLIKTSFSLYIILLMLRMIIDIVHIHAFNPLANLIFKATNPVLNPLHRFIKPFKNIDLAALFVILALQMLALYLLGWLKFGTWIYFGGVFVWAIGQLGELLINLYFFGILIVVIASWVAPHSQQPALTLVYEIVNPLLNRVRRFAPTVAGFDLSPVIVIVVLKLVEFLIISPLIGQGVRMTLGAHMAVAAAVPLL